MTEQHGRRPGEPPEPGYGYATRRDDPPAYETRRDDPPAYETRRDDPPAYETRRDGGAGRHARGPADSLLSLPPELAARYTVLEELPNPGTEADVLRVSDRDGAELVVKLYRRGMHADPAVWAKLGSIPSRHVVLFRETGTAAGRDFECMEYLPGGNLTALVDPPDTPLPEDLVTEVVRQIADALVALHARGIIHRDLKPENVLIRRDDPLELAVTDFGLARVLEQSVVAASRSGTTAYLAPELLLRSGGQSSRARDWWALGMIARELLIGRRPFEEMIEASIESSVMLRGIDLSRVTTPRMQLLCRGLLTRDPEDRWGAAQVTEWLEGGSPAVVDTGAARDGLRGLLFYGTVYTGRRELARALARDWDTAARRYFAVMGSPDHPSDGWRTLRDWLIQFDDPAVDDVEGRQDLIDQHLLRPAPPDVKLLRLLAWLDPQLPPTYRGASLAPADIPALAHAAEHPQTPAGANAARVVDDLWEHDLLVVLADFAGGAELRPLNGRWRARHAEWERFDSQLGELLPQPVPPTTGAAVLAPLLAIAARPEEELRRLEEQVRSTLTTLPSRLPWLDRLTERAARSPLGVVTVRRVLPAAMADSHRIAQEQAAGRAERQARHQRWQGRENDRLAGAEEAVTRANTVVGVWCAVMAILAFVPLASSTGAAMMFVSLAVALGAGAAELRAEAGLARELAYDYHPGYSITSRLGPALLRAREHVRGAGPGCLVVILVVFGIGLVFAVPAVLFGVVCLWHLSSVADRRRRWRAHHEEEAGQALGTGP